MSWQLFLLFKWLYVDFLNILILLVMWTEPSFYAKQWSERLKHGQQVLSKMSQPQNIPASKHPKP
jgi:hypothetical protein